MDTNELDRLAAEVKAALQRGKAGRPPDDSHGSRPADVPRLVTEEYVRAAHGRGETVIRVSPGALVTPLAKDALALYQMAVASALDGRTVASGRAVSAALPAGAKRVAVGVVATAKVEPALVEALRAAGMAVVRVQGSARKAGQLARSVAGTVASGQADWGVVVDETGLVAAAIANRVKGVRAACCNDAASAKAARDLLAANVVCMGADIVAPQLMREILAVWMATEPHISADIAALLDAPGG